MLTSTRTASRARADRVAALFIASGIALAGSATAQEATLRGYAEPRLAEDRLTDLAPAASWSASRATEWAASLPESRPWAKEWQLDPLPPVPAPRTPQRSTPLAPPQGENTGVTELAVHRPAPPSSSAAGIKAPSEAMGATTDETPEPALTTLSGYVEFELRAFVHSGQDPHQADSHPSIAFEPEYYREWNDGHDAVTVTPFVRIDQRDSKRTHSDLREANWLHVGDGWQVRLGIGKVFWGSTESQHLVDIVNQTDTLEGVDGEDKLGQPMVHGAWLLDNGALSLFWLPYFRERTFTGIDGRPRSEPRVDGDQARYESSREEAHQDFAIRWSASIDAVDLALSHFRGTSREPQFEGGLDGGGQPVLVPVYPLINQTGLELTAALGDWLWKLEAIRRSGFGSTYHAAVGGFEYTWVGAFDSDLDLGLLLEYHRDERGRAATSPFQNDTFAGLRLTFNDFQSSELLAGVIFDHDSSAHLGFIEASRRLGEAFKLRLELRLFNNLPPDDPLYSFRLDDFLQLNLAYYF